jgi:hypothetical protein
VNPERVHRRRHSDNEKFCSSLNHPQGMQNVRIANEQVAEFGDFQAEYEGSIPFTRSIHP